MVVCADENRLPRHRHQSPQQAENQEIVAPVVDVDHQALDCRTHERHIEQHTQREGDHVGDRQELGDRVGRPRQSEQSRDGRDGDECLVQPGGGRVGGGETVLLLLNAGGRSVRFALPRLPEPGSWIEELNTARHGSRPVRVDPVSLLGHSLVLLRHTERAD